MRPVFVAIEENSPALRSACGAYNLIGIYKTWKMALQATKTWVENNFNIGYYPTGETTIDRTKQEYYNIVYQDGNPDSDLWVELHVKPVEIQTYIKA